MTPTDADLRDILTRTRRIALVGFSANPDRPSNGVARYLQAQGYDLVLVNPGLAGQRHLGGVVHEALADIAGDVDMVDVFRASDAVPGILAEALARWPHLPVLWLQLGVRHPAAEAAARARGVTVVADRCPKIEHQRLFRPR